MCDVAELQQTDTGHDAERVFQERQAATQEEASHEAPARPPEPVGPDHVDRLAFPETGREGQQQVGQGGCRTHLDELGSGSHVVQDEHTGGRASHDHQKMREARAQREAG